MELIGIAILVAIGYVLWKDSRKPAPVSRIETSREDVEPLDAPGWDDAEVEWAPSNPRPIQASLRLNYSDASGKSTERTVDVKECDTTNPAGLMIGYCHLRGSIRTFRMDRIKRAVDMETGEVILDLPGYAASKFAASPLSACQRLLNDSMDALRALFYIGKADGRFTSKEKQIFLDFCRTAAGDDRITLKQIEDVCACLPAPTKQAYKLICGRLAKSDDLQRQAILNATEQMIATEKTVAPEEAEALAYMKKRFSITNTAVA